MSESLGWLVVFLPSGATDQKRGDHPGTPFLWVYNSRMEIRNLQVAEIRVEAKAEDGTQRVGGVAVPFNSPTMIGDFFEEKFANGAFTRTLKDDDQVLLIEHGGSPIARASMDTLTFRQSKDALEFQAVLDPRDSQAADMLVKVERGDVQHMSIGFKAEVEEWDESSEPVKRTVKRAKLVEVSMVGRAAYNNTSVAMRSAEEALGRFKADQKDANRAFSMREKVNKLKERMLQHRMLALAIRRRS